MKKYYGGRTRIASKEKKKKHKIELPEIGEFNKSRTKNDKQRPITKHSDTRT